MEVVQPTSGQQRTKEWRKKMETAVLGLGFKVQSEGPGIGFKV